MVGTTSGYEAAVDQFVTKMRRRQVVGSQSSAKLTAELLRLVVSHQRLPSSGQAAALIEAVKAVGVRIIAANPIGFSLFFTLPLFKSDSFFSSVF
jgi:translation initiation factor eIF-2B subunit beta